MKTSLVLDIKLFVIAIVLIVPPPFNFFIFVFLFVGLIKNPWNNNHHGFKILSLECVENVIEPLKKHDNLTVLDVFNLFTKLVI